MGYYADVVGSNFVIPSSKIEEANRIAVDLVAQRKDASYVWYPSETDGVLDLLLNLGFEVYATTEEVSIVSYSDKYNEEFDEYLFPAFVSVLDGEPYVEWRGEDGELWKWTPDGQVPGEVVYSDVVESTLSKARKAIEQVYAEAGMDVTAEFPTKVLEALDSVR